MWLLFAGCGPIEPPDRAEDLLDDSGVDSTAEPPDEPPIWSDSPLPTTVHGWSFRVEAPSEGPAEIRCALREDPEEVHVVRAAEQARIHERSIYGLLAGATYDCALAMAGITEDRTIATGPRSEELPRWTVTGSGGEGYTLLNNGTDLRWNRKSKLMIVDQKGRLRWWYRVPWPAADLDAQYLGEGRILYGGGYSAPPTIIDLSGQILAEAPESSTGYPYHHHAERIATGEIVTLTQSVNIDGISEWWTGFAVDILDPELGGRTWSWDSQAGYDAGWLPAGTHEHRDAYHANSVQVDGDEIYLNLRERSVLFKLSRSTGERIWTLGPGADFALLLPSGAPASDADWFYRAHAPEKEGDRILLYDNGVGRPGGSSSRILELRLDEAARTAQIVWSYTEPGWYEPIWGDVDRLPDGRVLFVRAHSAVTVPLLSYQRTEIVEIDPRTDLVTWRMTFEGLHDAGYRAQRIDGCALFANAEACPSLR